MAHARVCAAAETWLADHWTHADVPIRGANVGTDVPDDGSAFLKVDFPWCRAEPASFGSPGNNVYREEGGFRILIFVPRGIGVSEVRQWSSDIEEIFRGKLIADTIRCFAPVTSDDGEDGDGNYYISSVAVPYTFDLLG